MQGVLGHYFASHLRTISKMDSLTDFQITPLLSFVGITFCPSGADHSAREERIESVSDRACAGRSIDLRMHA